MHQAAPDCYDHHQHYSLPSPIFMLKKSSLTNNHGSHVFLVILSSLLTLTLTLTSL